MGPSKSLWTQFLSSLICPLIQIYYLIFCWNNILENFAIANESRMNLSLWPCLNRGLPNDWPKARSPGQRYIMLSIDPPVKLYEYRRLERLNFNWTMTYRMDSTFPVPYSTVERVLPLPAEPGTSQVWSLTHEIKVFNFLYLAGAKRIWNVIFLKNHDSEP